MFEPIEVTTHNLYFHEDSPITSLDYKGNEILTSGQDCVVRRWNVDVTLNNKYYETNCYKTANNSSLKINYVRDYKVKGPVNIVRIYREADKMIFACGMETGGVKLFNEVEDYIITLFKSNGDACCDLCFITATRVCAVFMSGTLRIVDIIDKGGKKVTNILHSLQAHNGSIQGVSYCNIYNLIITKSLDNTVNIYKLEDDNIKLFSIIDIDIDDSCGISKRILVKDKRAYIFTKNNMLSIYEMPFNEKIGEIGPFNAPLVKVICEGDFLIILTKKSIYILHKEKKVAYIDNAAYREITDGFMSNGIIFYSRADGFIGSVRLTL